MNEVGSVPVTVTAFEWLCPGVLPEVSGQLVASCKTPHAALPRTPVRFLACRTNKKRGGGVNKHTHKGFPAEAGNGFVIQMRSDQSPRWWGWGRGRAEAR